MGLIILKLELVTNSELNQVAAALVVMTTIVFVNLCQTDVVTKIEHEVADFV
jgi:hypothetical protein